MKHLYLLLFCLPLSLNAQNRPPSHIQRATTLMPNSPDKASGDIMHDSTTIYEPLPASSASREAARRNTNFEEAIRKLGPDLITPRLTINTYVLESLVELLEVQPGVRLVLAVDHSALSVRYALVHQLLEDLKAYPMVKPRIDIEMYAPISKYHTTWLYSRRLGHLMIRLERLSR